MTRLKVICSVGNGEMLAETCLGCAARSPHPPCGFTYALLRALYASNEKEDRASEIHVTDLVGCIKKAFLDKCQPAAERPHEMLVRFLGSGFHGMVEADDPLFDSELPLAYDGIVGRSDIVYKNGTLVDMKYTRWMYVNRLPYGTHALQVNIYAWMLRKMGREVSRLQIQYIDASGPTKCRACRVPVRLIGGELKCPRCLRVPKDPHLGAYLVDIPMMTDEEVEGIITSRKQNLEAAMAMGIAPAPEPGFLCAYCTHEETCQPQLIEG